MRANADWRLCANRLKGCGIQEAGRRVEECMTRSPYAGRGFGGQGRENPGESNQIKPFNLGPGQGRKAERQVELDTHATENIAAAGPLDSAALHQNDGAGEGRKAERQVESDTRATENIAAAGPLDTAAVRQNEGAGEGGKAERQVESGTHATENIAAAGPLDSAAVRQIEGWNPGESNQIKPFNGGPGKSREAERQIEAGTHATENIAAAGPLDTAALVSWLCRRKRAFPWGRSGTENRVNPSRARASKLLRRLNPVL